MNAGIGLAALSVSHFTTVTAGVAIGLFITGAHADGMVIAIGAIAFLFVASSAFISLTAGGMH